LTEDEIDEIDRLTSDISFLDWKTRLPLVYPKHFSKPFSSYHAEFWEWVDGIRLGVPSPAFFGIWPRGSGKSTGAEVLPIELGGQNKRSYAWYVRETQDQADKSIGNIDALLGSSRVERSYPLMSERLITKYGKPKAWRRDRLTTAGGFTLDGLGLDKAVRGVKDVEQRPDLIIIDDIDDRHDTAKATQKKIETLTQSLIPAGSTDVTVIFIQNLITPDGVMSQLVDGRAEFLLDRVVSGPHKAVDNLIYERDPETGLYRVLSGDATWTAGQSLEVAEHQINTWGLTSFLREAQHEVELTGGMYDQIEFRRCTWDEIPDLDRVVVWVDPAVTSTDKSDSMGIQADAVSGGILYRLYSWEAITSPEDAIARAIRKAVELGSVKVGVETDQGGDTWRSVFNASLATVKKEIKESYKRKFGDDYKKEYNKIYWPAFDSAKAGAGHGGKVERGLRMLADYERGKIIHVVGTSGILEKALRRFPKKPLDLADAGYWSWHDLLGDDNWLIS